ncbi:MAG: hypothetical protein AB8B88_04945, partial [Devosiaceae bacterium]
ATPPPLYPKLVTLRADANVPPDFSGPSFSGAVKDSFASLDFAMLGMNLLFEAQWIWCEAKASPMPKGWARVTTPDHLAAWQTAWGGPPVFHATCLDDPNLIFLARWEGEQITAGCLANISHDVIGISNVFSEEPIFAQAAQAVSAISNGKPLVGYESGEDVTQAEAAGFETVGTLRVLLPQS